MSDNRKRSVELGQLLRRLPASTQVIGDVGRLVTGIALDSRTVAPGELFVAVPGTRVDGHDFIAQAIAKGAIAVVVEAARRQHAPPHVTVVHVPHARRALSALAAAFYGDPSHELDVVGVTGTNGKTTVVAMVAAIASAAGRRCGTIGTVGAQFEEERWDLSNTTPLAPQLHGLLAHMHDGGADTVAMEVSSHALALDRVDDVRFAVGALTNITRDHLDFHETLEAYAAAKHRLFSLAHQAVLNVDDDHGERWSHELRGRGIPAVLYGFRSGADLVPRNLALNAGGSTFSVDGQPFELRVPGRFNVANALAAIGCARALGIDDAVAARGLLALERVPGRMEHVRGGGVDVVVDYAHTPDALENVLRTLRETTRGALTVVFGCGGDRDRGKRPEMGSVAARLADRIYVTNDNPRSEDPQSIADAIVAGIGAHPHTVELDRRRAIERAIGEASAGDVVLVAGKGHEAYQIVGRDVFDFDDVAVARAAVVGRGVSP